MANAPLGNDSLSRYLDWAMNNISSTHHHNGTRFGQFVRLDQAFEIAFQNLSDFEDDGVLGSLLTRSWFAFRGACMIAMSGQAVEVYILMRGCLEAALYVLHTEANPSFGWSGSIATK